MGQNFTEPPPSSSNFSLIRGRNIVILSPYELTDRVEVAQCPRFDFEELEDLRSLSIEDGLELRIRWVGFVEGEIAEEVSRPMGLRGPMIIAMPKARNKLKGRSLSYNYLRWAQSERNGGGYCVHERTWLKWSSGFEI